ncbi:Asp-tRNA(Asn)/Glu-tRNA(Gln) amidotransferase subunit GatC [Candidatus Neomarinimicrobiota bacterium]
MKKQTVTREAIEKIAQLAKLHLSQDQSEVYTEQINAILEHMQKLDSLDLTDIEPLSHVLELVNMTRDDHAAPSLPRDQVLANVPVTESEPSEKRATDGEFILVPQVIKTDQ